MGAHRASRERGSIVVVYAAVAGLLVAGAAVSAGAVHEYHLAQRTVHQTQAFYLAEAGLDTALVALCSDARYSGTGYVTLYDEDNQAIGGYDITVTDLGSNQRQVTAVGRYPDNDPSAAWYADTTVQGTVTVSSAPFAAAAFAQQSVSFAGNGTVDSYDSRDGPYSAHTAHAHGDVGTNGVQASAVNVSGNAKINGDVEVGPGANVNQAITLSGNATITGTKTAQSSATPLNVVTASGLTNLGDLSVSGNNTVTLSAGTYYYDDIKVSGNGKVKFNGPVTLYLSGTLRISGNGFSTSSNTPTNLTVYVETSQPVSFTGNANFYGVVYAPLSAVSTSGNGSVYGAMVGKTVTMRGNGHLHYDEALGGVGGGSSATLNLWEQP